MITGLSAFPLTPLRDDRVDEAALAGLVGRLAGAGVDSIAVLGSTGSYAYLDPGERALVARAAVAAAGSVPVVVGIGALRTSWVLAHADAAQQAGAAALLLAPVTYQALTGDEVVELFRTVTANASVPVILYDNPATTHVTFTPELYARIAALEGVRSIKIPGVPQDPGAAREHVRRIRDLVPADVTLGVSGDARAADGLLAGCEAWYSVIAGTLPGAALPIVRAAQDGDAVRAREASARLAPLWELFGRHGSLRVTATVAELLGLVREPCLPRPLLGMSRDARRELAGVVQDLGLAGLVGPADG